MRKWNSYPSTRHCNTGHLGATHILLLLLKYCNQAVLFKPKAMLTFAAGRKESYVQWPATKAT